MSHTSAPEQNLQFNIGQGRRCIETPETCSLETSTERDAASTGKTPKDGKHGDNCAGICAFENRGIGKSAAEANTMQEERTRTESIVSSASNPRLPYVDNSSTESLSDFGFLYVNSTGDEKNPSSTEIQNWNCHLCCKINEIEAENPQAWADVGSDHCTNFGCRHPRCSDCYYLNWAWRPIQFCDGRPADREAYEDWYNTFERV